MKSAKENKTSGLFTTFIPEHASIAFLISMDAKQDPKREIWEFQLAESFNRHNTCFAGILMVLDIEVTERDSWIQNIYFLYTYVHSWKLFFFFNI